jgi:hypothetical protein
LLTLDLPLCVVISCVGGSLVHAGLCRRFDPAGYPACERCGTRLNRVRHTRASGPGRACHPECRSRKHQLEECAATEERPKKKQRRTNSDPGKPQEQTLPIASTRLRVRPSKPPPLPPKPRLVKPSADPVDSMALLDAAHARRMALIEAETTVGLSFGANS